ncbi:PCDH1-like protein [Mya arenaria]|uniref:PCDH1-like protein n=1 Tax=Mya arenaria TaxID=6604 RepID=A0ABY7DQU0_MYAAR|nr:protocadherin beta-8-like [Mya arenaria]XP_052795960.1 protocadherin beta-8-like [Mya arenaria]XP_052795961.1 protocadherin beta-8-like [Mya arenaria]XP_052795963.1 protocadherin beta-8-like [Mya arenaria]XP_052795964.1 protocadherin beta-8-like [Mya arenaria]WAQ99266.1 PCDH1-like protein [Mya arenaria]
MSLFINLIIIAAVVVIVTATIPPIRFTMTEEEPSGYRVGSVANETQQYLEWDPTDLTYSTEGSTLFSINDETGDIYTLVVIDREHVCEYQSDCMVKMDVAVRSTDNRLFEVISVEIIIEDKNDNTPMFPTDVTKVDIAENSPVGSAFKIELATDKDTGAQNSVQSYELLLNEGSTGYFSLNITKNLDSTFNLKLILTKELNREVKDSYSVVVIAKDGGNPVKSGTQRININVTDVNDNDPQFTQTFYNVTIKETSGIHETILYLSANDKDAYENARVSYRISEFYLNNDGLREIFYLVEETGELKVKSDLSSYAGQSFKFFVEAFDHGAVPRSSQAEVEVHIQDSGNNAPIVSFSFFSPGNTGYVNVPENALNQTFVAHVSVTDLDSGENGQIECRISNTHFAIVKMDKGYKVVVNAILDREVLSTYNLTVTCSDKGTPVMSDSASFFVHITDYNDNRPVFDPQIYRVKLTENNQGTELITKVMATDEDDGKNAIFHYVPHEDAMDRFVVDSNTGKVTVNAVFDREVEPVVVFRVLAVDNGNPALTGTATVFLTLLDVNDNAPTFTESSYKIAVKENQETGSDVFKFRADDKDDGVNAEFVFSLAPEFVSSVPFVMFSNGQLKTNKQLDREERSRYDFVAIVTDRGNPQQSSRVPVIVSVEDVNDNQPVITFPRPSNNSVIVSYPDFESEYITTVEAYDLDEGRNKELFYSIVAGNDMDIFEMDSVFGNLYFKSQIDIGADKIIALDISVKDKGDNPLETIKTLFVELKYTNATFLKSISDGANSSNVIISVVVVIITLVISGVIIGVILFLRTLDRKRKEKESNSTSSTLESDFGFTQQNPNHTILSVDTLSSGSACEGQDLIKKKEVSFVLDGNDSYEFNQQRQTTSTAAKDKPSKSSLRYLPQQFPHHASSPASQDARDHMSGSPTVLDSRELQHEANNQLHSLKLQQVILQNRAKQWVEQQHQFGTCPDDHHSEGSAETIPSDSGRGCSEEDDMFSTPSADDPKLFELSSPESQRSSGLIPPPKPYHAVLEPQNSTSIYTKQPWSRRPHLASHRDTRPTQSQLSLNRNLNIRHSGYLDSVSSINNESQNRMSWGSALYGNVMPMDFTGDSALHSFFDKTPMTYANAYRDDEDTCSTTTSGSYTIYSEEIL